MPSACDTDSAGIVIVGSSPDMPGAPVVTLLKITTPIAPAFCAFLTFSTNRQTPRSMAAILPATAAALVNAVQPSVLVGPVGLAASSASATSAVTSKPWGPNAAVSEVLTPAIGAGGFTLSSDTPPVQKCMRMRGRWPSGRVDMFALLLPPKSCASATMLSLPRPPRP